MENKREGERLRNWKLKRERERGGSSERYEAIGKERKKDRDIAI